jgi:hypothetical protein
MKRHAHLKAVRAERPAQFVSDGGIVLDDEHADDRRGLRRELDSPRRFERSSGGHPLETRTQEVYRRRFGLN